MALGTAIANLLDSSYPPVLVSQPHSRAILQIPAGRTSSKSFFSFPHMPLSTVEFLAKNCSSSNTTFLTSARGGLLQLLGSSLSACCRYRPAKVLCRLSQIAALHAAFAPSRRARAFGVHVFEATCAFTFVTAR
jgi:hypothetical protein